MPYIEGAQFRMAGTAGQQTSGYGPAIHAGTPAAGTFGAGALEKGALAIDSTGGVLYINTGTKASPTWTVAGTQT